MKNDLDLINELVDISEDGYKKLVNKIYGENNINIKDMLFKAISDCELFVIDKDRKAIGYIAYQLEEGKMTWRLWGVKKSYRGTKLGLQMTDELIDMARDNEVNSIVIKPNVVEKGIMRYAKSRGFKKVDNGDNVIYEKILKEVN